MQNDPELVACPSCNAPIMSKCWPIHQRACLRRLTASKTKPSRLTELIPCTECGESVDFSLFSAHLEECVGRQLSKCPICKLLYPIYLFEEHAALCNDFREEPPSPEKYRGYQQRQQQEEEIYIALQDPGSDSQDEELMQMIQKLAVSTSNDDPVPLALIDKMRRRPTEENEECSICYCLIARQTTVIRLPCPHHFHPRCLTAWLQKNPHCPMCRRHALS